MLSGSRRFGFFTKSLQRNTLHQLQPAFSTNGDYDVA